MKINLRNTTFLFVALIILCLVGCSKTGSTGNTTTSVAPEPLVITATVVEPEYLYGYAPMTFAEFWYGEINKVEKVDTFNSSNPDLTRTPGIMIVQCMMLSPVQLLAMDSSVPDLLTLSKLLWTMGMKRS